MTKALAVSFLVAFLLACGQSSSTSDLKDSAQSNGACPSPNPSNLQGTVAVGGACTQASACAPTCCACSSNGYAGSSKRYLAVRCLDEKCVDPCAATASATYCN